jgi:dipeptidyl aminopeptidase/acylaminoacyl peptidase
MRAAAVALVVGVLSGAPAVSATESRVPVAGSVLFRIYGGPGTGVYAVDARGGQLKELVAGPAVEAHWSPDGTTLGLIRPVRTPDFPSEYDLDVLARAGGGLRHVVHLVNPSSGLPTFAWSPDGKRLAYVDGTGGGSAISVIGLDGHGPVRLSPPGRAADDSDPSWSPNGREIAFRRLVDWRTGTALFVVRADGKRQRQLTFGVQVASRASWSPDGTRIAFYPCCSKGFDIVDVDTQHLEALGPKTVLIPSWSPDGRWIGLGNFLIRPNGRQFHRMGTVPGITADQDSWSPDSRALAVTGPCCEPDVWVISADGRGQRQLTQGSVYGYGNYDAE